MSLVLVLTAAFAMSGTCRADDAQKDNENGSRLEATVSAGGIVEDGHPGPLAGASIQWTDHKGAGGYLEGQVGRTDTPIYYLKGSVLPGEIRLKNGDTLLIGAHARRVQLSDSITTTAGPEVRLDHGTTQHTLRGSFGTYSDDGDGMPHSGYAGLEYHMETNNSVLGGNKRLGWDLNVILADIMLPNGYSGNQHYFAVIEPGLNWDTGIHAGPLKLYLKPTVQLVGQDAKITNPDGSTTDADRVAVAGTLNFVIKAVK